MSKTIAIIGGGASGMMCAINAKHRLLETGKNARVILIEKNARAGKKLLSTGNGKCNLTNTNEDINAYHSHDIDAVCSVLKCFDVSSITDFFNKLSLTTTVANATCVYPRSMQASSVLDALRFEIQRLGIEILCEHEIKKITKKDDLYTIHSGASEITADAVVIASGSSASGGSDIGLKLLKSFGHKIYSTYPALCAVVCEGEITKMAKGMRAYAGISLLSDGKCIRKEMGEVLFCDYGLSGIAVMQLSGYISEIFNESKKCCLTLSVDLASEYDESALLCELKNRRDNLSYLTLENLLCGFLNKRIAMAAIKYANVASLSENISSLTDEQLKKIAHTLKHFDLKVVGTKGAQDAQVMGGGASLLDFNINTLESKKSSGLFACGEVLDVYGDCGGYNLTWAWASGAVCGKNVADII